MPPSRRKRGIAATVVFAVAVALAGASADDSLAATEGAVALSGVTCASHAFPALAADPFSDRVVAAFDTDRFTGVEGTEVASTLIGAGFATPQPGPIGRVSDVVQAGGSREFASNPSLAYNEARGGGVVRDSYVSVFASGAEGLVGSQVVARPVDSSGQPTGASSEISGALSFGRLPDIAYDGAREDEFVAVWIEANERQVVGRRVDRLGRASGAQFTVDGSADTAVQPAVAVDPFTGRVLVASGDNGQIQLSTLEGRDPVSVNSTWAASEGGASINTATGGPDVAVNTNRPGALVVWAGAGGAAGLAADEWEIWARLVGADGLPVGQPIRVSRMGPDGSAASGGFSPAVAFDSVNDRYVIVWDGDDETVGDERFDIWTRSISADGVLLGAQRPITAVPAGRVAFEPAVAVSGSGETVVAWHTSEGCELVGTTQVMAALVPATEPSSPAAPSVGVGDGSVAVWWNAPVDDGGSDLIGYEVTRSPGDQTIEVGAATTLVTFEGLTNGVGYTFEVVAINAAGRSEASPRSSVAVPFGRPGAPGKPTAAAGDGQVSLSWAPAAANGRPIEYYEIDVQPGGTRPLIDGDTTTAVIDGLANGVEYTFTVRAYSDLVSPSGTGVASAQSEPVTPVAAATVPDSPGAPLASAGDGWVEVSWDVPLDGGSAIETYRVVASPSGTTIDVAAPATSIVFEGLDNGTAYRFSVAAINAIGASAASPLSDRATPLASVVVPEPPGTPHARAGDGFVEVWWAPSPSDVSGYEVTAWSGGAGVGEVVAISTVSENEVVFEGLDNGTDLSFTVAGVNSAGFSVASSESNPVRPAAGSGYWVLELDGHVYPFGDAVLFGDVSDEMVLPVLGAIDIERLPTGDGYWILDTLGRVWAFGTAAHHGDVDLSQLVPGEAPATMSATPGGDGYWVFTDFGRALTFGSAEHFGDVVDLDLAGPIISSVATPTGRGYYMVGSDGGIFALGDARFNGSVPGVLPGVALDGPVVGIVPTPTGGGYWLVASDGGVFAFGDAWFNNSIPGVLDPGQSLAAPVNGMVAFADGYVMVAADGGVFNFSSQPFFGSLGADPPPHPIVGISPHEPVPAPGRFVGDWVGADPADGSTQTIRIDPTGWTERRGVEVWTYRVRWADDTATSCEPYGDAYPATLDGSASGSGNSLPISSFFSCTTPIGSIELGGFETTLVYDPDSDTLSDGVTEFARP